MKLKETKYIIGFALIAVGVGIVLATTLTKSIQYYVTVDELMAQKEEFVNKELKVAGKVSRGSIKKREADLSWEFDVENANQVVSVHYRGAMPDTFREGAEVVVQGTFRDSGQVEATHVLAKCASRYEEKLRPETRVPQKEDSENPSSL